MEVHPHPAFDRELHDLARSDPAAVNALRHALRVLEIHAGRVGHPWSSSVRGAGGLRELRPRSGRSRHRALYRVHAGRVEVLALAPEAGSDPRGFARAVARARERADRDTTGGTT